MALENPETMQQGHDASLGCFQAKGPFYSPKYGAKFTGPSTVYKHTGTANEGGAVRTDGARNSSTLATPNEYCQRPIHPHNYYFWSAYYPNALKEMQNQAYIMDNPFYAANHEHYMAAHNRFPCVPIQMNLQNYPQGHYFQDFQYFVVIDFEATCDKEKNPHPQEIIEFPSVLVNTGTGQLEDCFQTYVRPTCNQLLTDFCKELTGIQQPQVDKGVLLTEALLMHDKWLEEKGIKQTNFAVVTWSNWDCRVMLESECRFKRIRKPPYFNRWINLKVPFNEVFGVRCNLKEAVEMAGLTWEGRAHCGLDDAKNTARLLTHLMHRGFKFSITNSLMWQSSDYPCGVQPIPYPGRGLVYHQPPKWAPPFSLLPVQPAQASPAKEQHMYCYCGAVSIQRVVKKPGPKHGSSFFGCGNWSATRGAACPYFKWAASESEETV